MTITPEGLRERALNLPVRLNKLWVRNQLVAYAAALEELARLKAENESLAAQVAEAKAQTYQERLETNLALEQLAEANARAADRDRYVKGMANWKATAEAKDKQLAARDAEIAELREQADAVVADADSLQQHMSHLARLRDQERHPEIAEALVRVRTSVSVYRAGRKP